MENLLLDGPNAAFIKAKINEAFQEDLADAGDRTTQATIPSGAKARVVIRSRQPGCLAGLEVARLAFEMIERDLKFTPLSEDGQELVRGSEIASVEGSARALLTGERVALNFLGHLSGIASTTKAIVEAVAHTKAKICCTRKTTPGLRALEKYAVRAGGGVNHRFGLYDGILIKDNHIAIAGGVRPAIEAALAANTHMTKIEVEVDTLEQLEEALAYPIDAVLLDNMKPATLNKAVELTQGRVLLEASGGITAETVAPIAESGVDLISVGWITHSAPCLDVGLDFES